MHHMPYPQLPPILARRARPSGAITVRPIVAHGLLLTAILVAADRPYAKAVDSTPPAVVANPHCRLRTIAPANIGFRDFAPNSFTTLTSGNALTDNYQRDALAMDWHVPTEVDPHDGRVRCLVLSTHFPVLVDLSITVQEKPFRSIQEAWIDEALAKPAPTEVTKPVEASKDATSPAPTANSPQATPEFLKKHSARERLLAHVALSPSAVGREEARWLLTQWVPGSSILELDGSLSWRRQRIDPLFDLLDLDRNGRLDRAEKEQARDRMKMADANRNHDLETSEITKAVADYVRPPGESGSTELYFILRADRDWQPVLEALARLPADSGTLPGSVQVRQEFARRLGIADGSWPTPSQWLDEKWKSSLLEMEADVSVRVDFDAAKGGAEGVTLLALASHWGKMTERVHVREEVIAIDLGESHLEISAGQLAQRVSDAERGGQVSIGAAVDGFATYRLADQDFDQRLSPREQETWAERLAALPASADGTTAYPAAPLPLRLVAALGPHAHTMLANPDRATINAGAQQQVSTPPWFTAMDRNRDGELRRDEFLGTDEQFTKADRNGDGVIRAEEAAPAEQAASNSPQP